jgi:hypothetical protein
LHLSHSISLVGFLIENKSFYEHAPIKIVAKPFQKIEQVIKQEQENETR